MPNDNIKNLNDDVNVSSTSDDIIDLDAEIKPKKKTEKKIAKKSAKKTAKKTTKKRSTSSKSSKTKKTATKLSKAKKQSSIIVDAPKKSGSKSIEDELLKVTNIKSIEQVKKPKKIAMMVSFYLIIALAVIVFYLIKFSKTKNSDLLLEESINYDFLTEKVEATSRIVEESSSEMDYDNESSNKLLELTTKSINSYKSTTEREETIKKPESTVVEEATKRETENKAQMTTKAWPKRTNVKDILPKFKDVIYDYPTYYQMSLEEIGVIDNAISENYNAIKDDVFGENVSFSNKGANGILYLNYTYLKEYTDAYNSSIKQSYEQLPVVPYYNYIMNEKFNFDYKTYTTNLKMKLDFKNAKNQSLYYEVPATVYEPTGSNVSANGTNKITVRVLKKAKIGYTESFSLTALLEVLDIECHTKHNPFFDIEHVVGANPKAIADMKESGFDVRSMIDDETFNYVLFDKKGYITALYMLKS